MDHYEFPKVPKFDDQTKTHILFHHASQIVYLHDVFYYYYQRPGSDINPTDKQRKKFVKYRYNNSIFENVFITVISHVTKKLKNTVQDD